MQYKQLLGHCTIAMQYLQYHDSPVLLPDVVVANWLVKSVKGRVSGHSVCPHFLKHQPVTDGQLRQRRHTDLIQAITCGAPYCAGVNWSTFRGSLREREWVVVNLVRYTQHWHKIYTAITPIFDILLTVEASPQHGRRVCYWTSHTRHHWHNTWRYHPPCCCAYWSPEQ